MVTAATIPQRTDLVRPQHEVADIFRRYGREYRRTHCLSPDQRRVMRDLERCRTAALGGHVDECDHCGTVRIAYNSCRNRHCPKCQGSARARWVAQQQAALLPIQYFHVVFTLPELLHPLIRTDPRRWLDVLFRTVAATLLEFGERHLHGELGITAVLHTWGQTLVEHPHLHCLVTGGALTRDGRHFSRCRPGYLFPVRALAQVFRGKYLAALQQAYDRGELPVAGGGSSAAARDGALLLRRLRAQPWVVYAKRPFAGPEQVVGYIGRYTHRVAITNYRLLSIEEGRVCFTWKDYRDGGRQKVLTLTAMEFIRRFLRHVLPPGWVRIRHYGLLANGRRAKLTRCRELLAAPERVTVPAGGDPGRSGASEARCPQCGRGRLLRRCELSPHRGEDPLTAAGRARLNLHRPQPATGGFVQPGVAAATPAVLARSDG